MFQSELVAVPASGRAWARAPAAFVAFAGPLDLLTRCAGRSSPCIKPRDAQHDLMSQAIDGRLKGHVGLHGDAFLRARVSRTGGGRKVFVEASA